MAKQTTKTKTESHKTESAKFVETAVSASEPVVIANTAILDDIRVATGLDISSLPEEVQKVMIAQHLEKTALAKQLADVKEAASKGKVESFESALKHYSNPDYHSFSITFPLDVSWKYTQANDGTIHIDPLTFELSRWEFKQKISITMNSEQQKAVADFLNALGYLDRSKLDLARMTGEKEYKASLQRKSEKAKKKADAIGLQTNSELAARNKAIMDSAPSRPLESAPKPKSIIKK